MYPILGQFGPITLYSLWIFITIGFFVALLILIKLLQKDRQRLNFIANHSVILFLGGIVGSRIVFVLQNYQFYFENFNTSRIYELFSIWDRGLSFWGGVLGIILTLLILCRKDFMNFLHWLDILFISIFGGFSIANIGVFLDGRSYGNETNLPWGVIIPNSRFAIPIHPTQIYAAIYSFLICIVLFWLYKNNVLRKEGIIAFIGTLSYSFLRFLEEFLRGDESNYILGLREAQIYCILVFAISIFMLYLRSKKT